MAAGRGLIQREEAQEARKMALFLQQMQTGDGRGEGGQGQLRDPPPAGVTRAGSGPAPREEEEGGGMGEIKAPGGRRGGLRSLRPHPAR